MAASGLSERRAIAATAEELARGAGRILASWWERLGAADVGTKSAERDLVTAADLASEEFLLEGLRRAFPGDAVLAEESGAAGAAGAAATWYVDPLDGTVNFVHRLPMVAVSLARVVAGRPEVAVVHLPRLGETFVAVRDGGATLDGRPLRVSATSAPREALLATGFPYRRHFLRENNLENFNRLFLHQRGVRRMGSAASDLAYVAAGRLDAFWELHLAPWDVAAGALLVAEAGGVVDTIVPGGDWLHGRNLIAGPPALVEALRALLRAGRGDDYPDLGEHAP
jgi:myo-inositol-1(or 4)-monophosphatase